MPRLAPLLGGVALGVLGLAAVRMAAAPPDPGTHFHANWAIFVNGVRVDLSAPHFMEEVSACYAGEGEIQPAQRVHMHDGNGDVVHVHDHGVTWGHLMANLGFGIGEGWLVLPGGAPLRADGERTLKFVVDGMEVLPAHNRLIRSTERLLISYGPESVDEVLATQFPQVASNAAEHNLLPDPAGCTGSDEITLGARIRHAFLGR